MKCEIGWIDCNGEETFHDETATCYVYMLPYKLRFGARVHNISRTHLYPCCDAHAARIETDNLSNWRIRKFPDTQPLIACVEFRDGGREYRIMMRKGIRGNTRHVWKRAERDFPGREIDSVSVVLFLADRIKGLGPLWMWP